MGLHTVADGRAADDRPVVGVWRSRWLPVSETFVADHVRSLQRWQALPFGLYADSSPVVRPERAPFPYSATGRRLARLSRRVGHIGVYDRLLRRHDVRLVHAHFGTGAVEVMPVVRRLGIPLVVTFHGHDVNRAPTEAGGELYRRRLTEVFDRADRLVAVSHFLAAQLERLGAPVGKIEVRHLGIPVDHTPDPPAARGGLLYVGRLVRYKGVADLLSAYAQLPPGLRAATPLRIVGDGPERQALQEQARTIDGQAIEFLGSQPPRVVRRLMGEADVFVAPSTSLPTGENEAFGLTMIEAALQGTSVVAYATGGALEAVEDGVTGMLARADDVGDLAARIASLLADSSLRKRMGAAGRARVLRDFDLQACQARLEDLYDEVVAARASTGRSAS